MAQEEPPIYENISKPRQMLLFEQILQKVTTLSSEDIASVLSFLDENDLKQQSELLAKAKELFTKGKSSSKKSKNSDNAKALKKEAQVYYQQAYNYALIAKSMCEDQNNILDGIDEIFGQHENVLGFRLMKLLKKDENGNKEIFEKCLTHYCEAMEYRKNNAHDHQKAVSNYVSTVHTFIKNGALDQEERKKLITDALSVALESINKNHEDKQVKKVCSYLAHLLFAEAKETKNKVLAEFAESFNAKSLVNVKKNSDVEKSRKKLQNEISEFIKRGQSKDNGGSENNGNAASEQNYTEIVTLANQIKELFSNDESEKVLDKDQ